MRTLRSAASAWRTFLNSVTSVRRPVTLALSAASCSAIPVGVNWVEACVFRIVTTHLAASLTVASLTTCGSIPWSKNPFSA
ncbi:hypothetical protein BGY98DRAFT_1001776 [Russula aff. rugulosa BPL654]|nr:hypothetical protein BGY98DRAFT_1001776 [Russula aff. rugulosa BPL654]